MKENSFDKAMAAAANQDVEAIKAMHHEDFFALWDTEMAQLEKHLMRQKKFTTDNPDVNKAECLLKDNECLVTRQNKADGKGIYAINLKKDGNFYRNFFNSNKP